MIPNIRPNLFIPARVITSLLLLLYISADALSQNNQLPGFTSMLEPAEQIRVMNPYPDIRVCINAPAADQFDPHLPVHLVFYGLPNGSSIEETIGKRVENEADHKFGIQHIGAQTRFVRHSEPGYNLVVIYLENEKKSWPAWKAEHPDHAMVTHNLVEQVRGIFKAYETRTILNGHSGGGRLIFSYLDYAPTIPDHVSRIAFLDSNYGYESEYGEKLAEWLKRSDRNKLLVLAYNDSIALYKGKPFVSPTGGTWYRSKMQLKELSEHFEFQKKDSDSLLWYYTPNRQIEFILKRNPNRAIFHTEQVEFNGFIHSLFFGTPREEQGYEYFGPIAYKGFISTVHSPDEPE